MPAIQGQFPRIIKTSELTSKNSLQVNGFASGGKMGWAAAGDFDLRLDGKPDVALGAPYAGFTYVLHSPITSQNGSLEISALNNTQRTQLIGPASGLSGYALKGAGLANGGLFVGVPQFGVAGQTFFVNSTKNFTSPLQLANLNPPQVYTLTGENGNYGTGYAIEIIEINGTMAQIFGCYYCQGTNLQGKTFVLPWNLTALTSPYPLSRLRGPNGYEQVGMPPVGGYFGKSVKKLKNATGDGADGFISGAPGDGAPATAGYAVITLKANFTTSPQQVSTPFPEKVIAYAEAAGDQAGSDVSGDGNGNYLISSAKASPTNPTRTNGGKVYLGYAKAAGEVWPSQMPLASFNGSAATGSIFNGRAANAQFGCKLEEVGKFFGDGLPAWAAVSCGLGEVDIFRGKPRGVLWPSPVEVSALTSWDAITIQVPGATTLTIAAAGKFIGDDDVDDLIVCDPNATPLLPNGTPDSTRTSAGVCWIIAGDIPPELVNNELTVPPLTSVPGNITLPFGANALAAIDGNHDNSTLTYVLQNITNSYIQHKLNRGVALANFTQQQVNDWDLELVIPNTAANSSFLMKLVTTGLAYLGPVPANFVAESPATSSPSTGSIAPTPAITSGTPSVSPSTVSPSSASPSYSPTFLPSFSPSSVTPTTPPTPTPGIGFVHNAMTLANCEAVTLTPAILQATKPGANDSLIQYMVGNLHDGRFFLKRDNMSTNSFPHYQVAAGEIEFRHACTNKAPTYSVIASEGGAVTEPNDAVITFANAPQVTLNPINLDRGQTITLTSAHIDITVNDGTIPRLVIITVTGLQNGWIENNSTVPPTRVTSFTLEDFDAGLIQLVSDGSTATPSFTISVSSATSASASITPRVIYSDRGIVAPRLRNNYLIVNQGQATTVAPLQFSAVDGYGQPVSDSAVYQQSSLQHGQFTVNATPTTTFTPAELRQGAVEFRDDGTGMPDFWTSVTANGLQSPAYPGTVFYTPEVAPPTIAPTSLPTSIAEVQSTPWYKTAGGIGGLGVAGLAVSAAVGLFWYCYDKKSTQTNSHEDKEDKDSYENRVVMPLAAKINELMDVDVLAGGNVLLDLKVAATAILKQLRDGHDLGNDTEQWDAPKLKAFINDIGVKTFEVIRQQKKGQGPDEPVIFSKRPRVSPNEITRAAEAIAQAVYDTYEIETAEASNHIASSMEMGQLSPKPSEPSASRRVTNIKTDRARAATEEQDDTPPAHAGESVEPENGSTPSRHSDEADSTPEKTPERRTPERAVDEELQSSDLQLTTADKGRGNKSKKKRKPR